MTITPPSDTVTPADVRADIADWVDEVAGLTQPSDIRWFDGSDQQRDVIADEMVAAGTLIRLNEDLRPNSFLARSAPEDVARVEERTFICSLDRDDAGPTNNWRAPAAMKDELRSLFDGSMRGRTMWVVPFSMGPVGGAISQIGIQITDSPYAVLSMALMTRAGSEALEAIGHDTEWVPALHSVGYPLETEGGIARPDVAWPHNPVKYISHFPETREIWSFGSGYGGNALLGKKCFSLRIASAMARDDGWLAEHMLLIKVTTPEDAVFHVAAAFPSACGKTNLAMMTPSIPGWKVETIGDDIAWMRPGTDGRLRAINPERGFFGVAPGTGYTTNPTAVHTLWGNAIFTNVALTDDGDIWWEGLTDEAPAHLIDWQGNDWTPNAGRPAAHPNARFTVAADQCPSIANDWDAADGVPVDAILFGGRRATNVPLVMQARDWDHGVFMGATISSEQTAAAEGTVGELRHDPFAMLPFCGYNMADYWAHWIKMRDVLNGNTPEVFQVNWFRKDARGKFLWPGFAENSRVIEWIIRRLEGKVAGVVDAIGLLPRPDQIDTDGIDVSRRQLEQLFEIDPTSWLEECDQLDRLFDRFGHRVPTQLRTQLELNRSNLRHAQDDAAPSLRGPR
ncbi:phosphoenolpyruvate carboxykinase (GTP) [Curtobacterium sp. MCBA15_004]|uniref:phosphoenolpyruvate carboxykinase (GTP) n=1 Tax=Curtobacterium sp. MCBA15_004 TaxID=1898733 RepID=UPI0008DD5B0A|nr:phosphoenolpyruvate carboxykinase (GTP) [Curtobacterium sp. MCBA15_004]WIA96958.1 phosphoenolpyruvate carboxykinase (GTP) [Curtobacterium sp. MCBA15_004]